jgi:hypothetical protein
VGDRSPILEGFLTWLVFSLAGALVLAAVIPSL